MSNPQKINKNKGILEHQPNEYNYSYLESLSEKEIRDILDKTWEKVKNNHKGREFVIYPPYNPKLSA